VLVPLAAGGQLGGSWQAFCGRVGGFQLCVGMHLTRVWSVCTGAPFPGRAAWHSHAGRHPGGRVGLAGWQGAPCLGLQARGWPSAAHQQQGTSHPCDERWGWCSSAPTEYPAHHHYARMMHGTSAVQHPKCKPPQPWRQGGAAPQRKPPQPAWQGGAAPQRKPSQPPRQNGAAPQRTPWQPPRQGGAAPHCKPSQPPWLCRE
jgi:hypothetical protein